MRKTRVLQNHDGVLCASAVFAASLLAFGIMSVWPKSAFAQADVENGKTVYTQKCASCHTLEPAPAHGTNGPSLLGVVGRMAGSVEGWDFSPALRDSKVTWTGENLNKWLTDPEAFVPGSKMPLKVPDKFEREDVIGYLQSAATNKK
jgi:cytochrome c2